MEKPAACKHVAAVAVPPCHGPCDLAISHLLLVAAGVWVGTACDIPIGGFAAGGSRRSRRHPFPYTLPRRTNRPPFLRRCAGHACITRQHGTRSAHNQCHSRQISYQPGIVDRFPPSGRIPRSPRPAPPKPRTHLTLA